MVFFISQMTLLSMSSCCSVDRAPTLCLGGHGFDCCQGLRLFLCPTLVSWWSILNKLLLFPFCKADKSSCLLDINGLLHYFTFQELCSNFGGRRQDFIVSCWQQNKWTVRQDIWHWWQLRRQPVIQSSKRDQVILWGVILTLYQPSLRAVLGKY